MPLPPLTAPRPPEKWRKGGTSQAERLPADLLPEHLKLDARTLPELLAYLAHFSEKVQFYTEPNAPAAGTWALARHRGLLLLAVVAAHPGGGPAAEAQLQPLHDPAATAAQRQQALPQLLELLHEQASTLHEWYTSWLAWVAGARQPDLQGLLAASVAAVAPALRRGAHFERLLAQQSTAAPPRGLVVVVFGRGRRLFLEDVAEALLEAEYREYAEQLRREELTREAMVAALVDLYWQLQAALVALAEAARSALPHELKHRRDHHPEESLLVAFLQLYTHAQAELNHIPQRHLDYYYRTVLRATGRLPVPDRTYLSFTLTQGVARHKLPAGTLATVGKDAGGQRIVFATTADATLANWKVAALATVFGARAPTPTGPGPVTGLYASPPAAGPPAPAPWPLFGSDQLPPAARDGGNQPARVGFAVAARLLSLQAGSRRLTLCLKVTAASLAQWQQEMQAASPPGYAVEALATAAFEAQLTGPAGWLPLAVAEVKIDAQAHTLTWTLLLDRAQPAGVGYLAQVHGDELATTQPVLRLLLRAGAPAYGYSSFVLLQPVAIDLQVMVEHLHDVQLSNQVGQLDPRTPFYPFGSSALPGDYLLIGVPELLHKHLTHLSVALTWQSLPPGGFGPYYQGYAPGPTDDALYQGCGSPLADDSFQVTTSYLSNYHWLASAPQPLFQADASGEPLRSVSLLRWPEPARLTAAPEGAAGLLRIELTAPAAGFGSGLYPQALREAVQYNAQFYLPNPPQGPRRPLPQLPYLPRLCGLSVSYHAEQPLAPGLDAAADRPAFFHIGPFAGYVPAAGLALQLLPAFENGELFVGLSPEAAGQPVQLVFDLTIRSLPESAQLPAPSWAYLRNDQWVPIEQAPGAEVSLPGFGNSCSVAVNLPALPNTHQTRMPAGLWWLRATVGSGAASFGRVRAMHSQLVPAVRTAPRPGPAATAQPVVPAHAPTRLLTPHPAIVAVAHPHPSFGGQAAESQSAYYSRVSERLRHRGRALTPWDYEHLVLEAFPQVHSALCLSANDVPGPRTPGQVTLVLLPQAQAGNPYPLFGPGELTRVQSYLQALAPPAVRVRVLNVCYEQVQVRSLVAFAPSAALPLARCEPQLQKDLRAFLSPWHQAPPRGGFHHYLTVPAVEAFLKLLPYVAGIGGFSVVKTGVEAGRHRLYDSATDARQPPEFMGASPLGGVQVPAQQHHFTVRHHLPAPAEAAPTGIERLRIGADFIVACDF
ncbi:baseplate J/gp47 family protein [Hymenobacter cheonanensis]|uniref:baseplate J/gp47 family protein n=1 Tax=Hymenobacter sp. CA2-7 TaxID=3063993 RepID=UPI0027124D16|nr:baseplate J/gp47 family protein [Hymenobacter sp. CA2-7]MDO7883972.1 baseplate J/gp47 family protein [Hymenobacter sp. CA2-7]